MHSLDLDFSFQESRTTLLEAALEAALTDAIELAVTNRSRLANTCISAAEKFSWGKSASDWELKSCSCLLCDPRFLSPRYILDAVPHEHDRIPGIQTRVE